MQYPSNPSNQQRHHRHTLAAIVGCALSCFGAGCAIEGDPNAGGVEARSVELTNDQASCVALIAGQHLNVGAVCVAVHHDVDTSLQCGAGSSGVVKVTYYTTGGWELVEAHLAAGDEYDDIPTNNPGHPQPGQFPYSQSGIYGSTHTFHVPLCAFALDDSDEQCDPVTAYFAAHAVVRTYYGNTYQEETAWGEGEEFDTQGGWAMFFNHGLSCEHPKAS